MVRRVPPVFFFEAKRARTIPFWKHLTLIPLDSQPAEPVTSRDEPTDGDSGDASGDEIAAECDDDDEDEDEEEDDGGGFSGPTFDEELLEHIDTITDFAEGLRYQIQFRDHRMLKTLKREGAPFLRLAQACLNKEKRLRTRGSNLATWDHSTSSAMFYRSRPNVSENR
jgi:hypothetical protein